MSLTCTSLWFERTMRLFAYHPNDILPLSFTGMMVGELEGNTTVFGWSVLVASDKVFAAMAETMLGLGGDPHLIPPYGESVFDVLKDYPEKLAILESILLRKSMAALPKVANYSPDESDFNM